ncbi:hypothetical protein ACTXT7_011446 [Hymenolepis weldensis]
MFHFISANEEDDAALTMEIEIENPGESTSKKVIHEFSMEENCLLGRSCNSGGICMDTTTLPDLSVAKGTCVCPLGYSGKFCDQKSFQARFPEIQDGGYLAFGGWLLPKTGPFSVSLQIKPHVLRPKTLLFFYFSKSRAQAFYLELNDGTSAGYGKAIHNVMERKQQSDKQESTTSREKDISICQDYFNIQPN